MKKLVMAVGLMAVAGTALAAGKPCAELQQEIEAKLDAKNVSNYVLEVVDKGTGGGKVVGSCEGGTKDIVYRREG
ncbi:DUF1161 domain-containing protein [Pseudomonas monteilii]|jgi:hypothetical protein|uniref:DUF1161 domain-containing protein n=1 Tax=Pseudomonas TaxID=286 RepID=UPI000745DB90|nr:DUF1161 domain-containing protein [Pseudomonas entomophila]AMA47698.1 hypothetical protein APT63_19855 [Pseudomonas monteilii]MBA1190398.1 DUF1161 domain-containing protein [Pseudomonas entomophila]